jgi:hypothetical protein
MRGRDFRGCDLIWMRQFAEPQIEVPNLGGMIEKRKIAGMN